MMQFKYITLISWYIGMVLLVSGLYLKDTKFKRKKLCVALSAIGATITAISLSTIILMTMILKG